MTTEWICKDEHDTEIEGVEDRGWVRTQHNEDMLPGEQICSYSRHRLGWV